MGFRDDRDALLARADALDRELSAHKEDLEETSRERDELRNERDALRAKLAKLEKKQKKNKPKPKPKSKPREQPAAGSAQHQQRIIAFGAVGLMMVVGVAIYMALLVRRSPAPSATAAAGKFQSMCPLERGRALVTIDRTRRKMQHYYFYSLWDADSGKRLKRAKLHSGRFAQAPSCLGYEGELVWFKQKKQFYARNLDTGEVVIKHADIVALLPATLERMDFDNKTKTVIARTRDGRAHQIVSKPSLSTRPFAEPHRIRASGGSRLPTGNASSWGNAKINNLRLWKKGRNPRVPIMLGDNQLGDSDWLKPSFMLNGANGTMAWNDPDSVIVVEETELSSRMYQLTRLSLEGNVLWRYKPKRKAVGYQNRSWFSSPTGKTLLVINEVPELVGVDPATGAEKFRAGL